MKTEIQNNESVIDWFKYTYYKVNDPTMMYKIGLNVHFDAKNNLKEVYMTIPDKETDEWDVIGNTLYGNFLFPQCHTLLTLTEFEELIELAKIKLKEEEKCTNSDTNC